MIHFLQIAEFSWKEFLLGAEEWQFLPEVLIRTVIMFIVILTGLTVLGKRGVKQLSVFELVVIIGLGSAAGDPMFYKDVGVIPAMLVFIVVIFLYSLVTKLMGKSKKFEHLVEGKPICLVKEGRFAIKNFSKQNLAQDEFFGELREKGVSHLGQVENAFIETHGEFSVFFYDEQEIKYGLPILPGSLDTEQVLISSEGYYACTFCGNTKKLESAPVQQCGECGQTKWVPASNKKRIT